jgi:hypothetical protein
MGIDCGELFCIDTLFLLTRYAPQSKILGI